MTAKKNSTSKKSSKARKVVNVVLPCHCDGTAFTAKRPGVNACILEMLLNASETTPVTKNQIIAELCSRFPGRSALKMAAYVGIMKQWIHNEGKGEVLSRRLQGATKGYWMAGLPKSLPIAQLDSVRFKVLAN